MDKPEEKKRVLVRVGDAEVDLTDLPPITLGDKKALRERGVDFMQLARMASFDPAQEAELVLFLLQKRRAETTMAEVDALPAVTAGRITAFALKRSAEVDDPFSTGSTSSLSSTGGGPKRSSEEALPS